VMTKSLVINEGAYYEGEMEMTSETRVAPGPPPRALPTAPVSTPSPRPTSPTPAPAQQAPATPPQSQAQSTSEPGSRTFIRRFGGPETAWDTESEGAPLDEPGTDNRS
jgi:hypothetical protein